MDNDAAPNSKRVPQEGSLLPCRRLASVPPEPSSRTTHVKLRPLWWVFEQLR
jgi:hypothetical protein